MAVQFGEPVIEDRTEVEKSLPDEFWNLPDTFISNENARKIYIETYKQLLAENPDRDTIELMMIERAAALYAYMRDMESTVGYRNTQDYRQLSALWTSMAQDLRKTRHANFSEEQIRQEIATEYIQIVNTALKGLDPETGASVRQRIYNALNSD